MGHMGMIRGLMNYPATKQINNPYQYRFNSFLFLIYGLLWYTHGYGNFHGCLDVKKAGILSSFNIMYTNHRCLPYVTDLISALRFVFGFPMTLGSDICGQP